MGRMVSRKVARQLALAFLSGIKRNVLHGCMPCGTLNPSQQNAMTALTTPTQGDASARGEDDLSQGASTPNDFKWA